MIGLAELDNISSNYGGNIIVFATVFTSILAWLWNRKGKDATPPGPWGLPIVGYLPFLRKDAHVQLAEMKKKYGNIISLTLGSRNVVVLLDFAVIKEAMNKESYLGRPTASSPFLIVKDGISFNDVSGDLWKNNRRFTLQVLRDLGFGRTHMQTHIQNEIGELVKILMEYKCGVCDTRDVFTSSVSNNITALIFGRRLEYTDPQRRFLDKVVLLIMDFFRQTSVHMYLPWVKKILIYFRLWKYDEAKTTLTNFFNFVEDEIQSHRKTMVEGHHRDYIDGYLQEMDRKEEAEKHGFTTRFLKGNIRTMFGAGSEASRTCLEWCMKIMAAYPEYQKRLQAEIDDIIGRERMPSMDDQSRTPLTFATVLEVLRYVGLIPLGIVRECTHDDTIKGYKISKGTVIMPNIWAVHHDPELWDEPMKFRPERFISEDGSRVNKPDYFIPFSMGRRSCPGEVLAYVEVYMYLASILQRFNITTIDGKFPSFDSDLGISLQLMDTRLIYTPRS